MASPAGSPRASPKVASKIKIKNVAQSVLRGVSSHAEDSKATLLKTSVGALLRELCERMCGGADYQLNQGELDLVEEYREKVFYLIHSDVKKEKLNQQRVHQTELHMDFLTQQLERRETFAIEQRKKLMKEIMSLREQLWRVKQGEEANMVAFNDLDYEHQSTLQLLSEETDSFFALLRGMFNATAADQDAVDRFKKFAEMLRKQKEVEVAATVSKLKLKFEEDLSIARRKVTELNAELDGYKYEATNKIAQVTETLESSARARDLQLRMNLATKHKKKLLVNSRAHELVAMDAHDYISELTQELLRAKQDVKAITKENTELESKLHECMKEKAKLNSQFEFVKRASDTKEEEPKQVPTQSIINFAPEFEPHEPEKPQVMHIENINRPRRKSNSALDTADELNFLHAVKEDKFPHKEDKEEICRLRKIEKVLTEQLDELQAKLGMAEQRIEEAMKEVDKERTGTSASTTLMLKSAMSILQNESPHAAIFKWQKETDVPPAYEGEHNWSIDITSFERDVPMPPRKDEDDDDGGLLRQHSDRKMSKKTKSSPSMLTRKHSSRSPSRSSAHPKMSDKKMSEPNLKGMSESSTRISTPRAHSPEKSKTPPPKKGTTESAEKESQAEKEQAKREGKEQAKEETTTSFEAPSIDIAASALFLERMERAETELTAKRDEATRLSEKLQEKEVEVVAMREKLQRARNTLATRLSAYPSPSSVLDGLNSTQKLFEEMEAMRGHHQEEVGALRQKVSILEARLEAQIIPPTLSSPSSPMHSPHSSLTRPASPRTGTSTLPLPTAQIAGLRGRTPSEEDGASDHDPTPLPSRPPPPRRAPMSPAIKIRKQLMARMKSPRRPVRTNATPSPWPTAPTSDGGLAAELPPSSTPNGEGKGGGTEAVEVKTGPNGSSDGNAPNTSNTASGTNGVDASNAVVLASASNTASGTNGVDAGNAAVLASASNTASGTNGVDASNASVLASARNAASSTNGVDVGIGADASQGTDARASQRIDARSWVDAGNDAAAGNGSDAQSMTRPLGYPLATSQSQTPTESPIKIPTGDRPILAHQEDDDEAKPLPSAEGARDELDARDVTGPQAGLDRSPHSGMETGGTTPRTPSAVHPTMVPNMVKSNMAEGFPRTPSSVAGSGQTPVGPNRREWVRANGQAEVGGYPAQGRRTPACQCELLKTKVGEGAAMIQQLIAEMAVVQDLYLKALAKEKEVGEVHVEEVRAIINGQGSGTNTVGLKGCFIGTADKGVNTDVTGTIGSGIKIPGTVPLSPESPLGMELGMDSKPEDSNAMGKAFHMTQSKVRVIEQKSAPITTLLPRVPTAKSARDDQAPAPRIYASAKGTTSGTPRPKASGGPATPVTTHNRHPYYAPQSIPILNHHSTEMIPNPSSLPEDDTRQLSPRTEEPTEIGLPATTLTLKYFFSTLPPPAHEEVVDMERKKEALWNERNDLIMRAIGLLDKTTKLSAHHPNSSWYEWVTLPGVDMADLVLAGARLYKVPANDLEDLVYKQRTPVTVTFPQTKPVPTRPMSASRTLQKGLWPEDRTSEDHYDFQGNLHPSSQRMSNFRHPSTLKSSSPRSQQRNMTARGPKAINKSGQDTVAAPPTTPRIQSPPKQTSVGIVSIV